MVASYTFELGGNDTGEDCGRTQTVTLSSQQAEELLSDLLSILRKEFVIKIIKDTIFFKDADYLADTISQVD